jgi:hypothetical protein
VKPLSSDGMDYDRHVQIYWVCILLYSVVPAKRIMTVYCLVNFPIHVVRDELRIDMARDSVRGVLAERKR